MATTGLLPEDLLPYVGGNSKRDFCIWEREFCDFQMYNHQAFVLSLAAVLSIIHGRANLQDQLKQMYSKWRNSI